jgi:hypothetical protein
MTRKQRELVNYVLKDLSEGTTFFANIAIRSLKNMGCLDGASIIQHAYDQKYAELIEGLTRKA